MRSGSAKLTLSLEKKTIESAKKYARKRGKSVSRMVQDYLSSIVQEESTPDKNNFGPITRELHGILKGKISLDYKWDIADYMDKKYR